ncbi:DUF6517 family protein [Halalkalicoccus tibetensis]|uniref:DUF6517 family protein n=1 Tax=Halalkalicoccus tibetensis TaxID=175632 RepID=A0ABD5V330_9EURY
MELDTEDDSDTEPESSRENVISAEPTPIAIDGATLEETDYEKTRDIIFELTQTISMKDESYIIEASNHLIECVRTIDRIDGEQPVAAFTAVGTPEIETVSQKVDFAERVTNEVIENSLQIGYETIEIEDQASTTHSVVPFENEVTVYQYPGVAEASDYKVDVHLHVARAVRETDYITLVGLYPYFLGDDEQDRIFDLMEAIE